jgi:hypothetical protein
MILNLMLEETMKNEDLTLYNSFFDCIEKGAKCSCGKKLRVGRMQWYPHKGGIRIPESNEKQWVYVICENCLTQISWKKLLGRYM